ncbi:MAG: DUF2961 domain-containing protein, partial [Anaerolineae bacterium]|nr:DUF2961 domain-containing protein [Anaerolineae bacterium]
IQQGKMRQVSSQGRQVPPDMMAKAIGAGEPGKSVQIAPGETYTVAEIAGAGTIRRIWMTVMNLPGAANFNHHLVLRMYWDGEQTPSVAAPFGDFFGVPWGKYTHYVAEPLSCTSGGYNCRFLMPFSRGCRIAVTNEADKPCPALFFQVQYSELAEQPSPLRFHAQWRRENPTQYRVPYRVLEAQGEGHFAGMHLWMQKSGWWFSPAQMIRRAKETGSLMSALFPEAMGMGMLEGWESIYVDGEKTPSIPGTGNEDYFNSGFYFSKGPYSAPHWGCTVRSYATSRCAAYRFHVADPIPFHKSIVVDIDHGYTNQVETDYSSVAYWYQVEPHATFPALLPVEQRLPTPTGRNALQWTLFTSPAWLPAALLGIKVLKKLFGKRE